MLKGIDVSNHQAGLVIPKDLDFVIAKATEGLGFVDAYCNDFISQAIKNGQLFGFYHYARPNDPIDEADFFISHTLGYFNKGIPVLDYEIEDAQPFGMSPAQWVETFCKHVKKRTGVAPIVYCSALAYPYNVTNVGSNWTCENCGLWIAGYPNNRETWREDEPPYSIDPWKIVAIWQFTSNLACSGYHVDADLAYMDAKAWQLYAGAKDVPDKKEDDMTPFDVWAYKNKKLEKDDAYQIMRDTRDMCKQVLKELAALEVEIAKLKSKG